VYVLLNSRHHAAEGGGVVPSGIMDGCSSAPWFDGWSHSDAVERAIVVPRAGPEDMPESPVAVARSWLLTTGWKQHGLLDPDDIPGPAGGPRRQGSPETETASR
jgi:hypothetical protein